MNNTERKAQAAAAIEEGHRMEPGIGLALVAVVVMLLTTAILCGLIYGLMIAIRPLESRHAQPAAIEHPLAPAPVSTPAKSAN